MMRVLILLHRWLGVAFCLLFAMWFASGIVMHFVPFPALTEAERLAGLPPIDIARVEHDPAQAIAASGLGNVRRVRLLQRSDGPVYVISGAARVQALRAADLPDAAIRSEQSALAIAVEHAGQRRLNASRAAFAELAQYDQWTVPRASAVCRVRSSGLVHDRSALGKCPARAAARVLPWSSSGSSAGKADLRTASVDA